MGNKFSNVTVKENYTLVSIVYDGHRYNAIIHREAVDDYVVCFGYDITDGTWGQGHYYNDYRDALADLADRIHPDTLTF